MQESIGRKTAEATHEVLATRDTVFISHATPDDNDFVRWLGARLTGHGYKVWADLFELRGGAPFWNSIEEALRHHAYKMIFVVSEKSIDPNRTGVRNELSVADTLKKTLKDPEFIIPVRIDDTAFGDFPIQIHQLNAIDFSKGWGPKLIDLIDTLEHANVPKFVHDQSAEFEKWRNTMVRTSTTVEIGPEPVLTNLLPIIKLPANISFFEHQHDVAKFAQVLSGTGIPNSAYFRLLISFADLPTIQKAIPTECKLSVRAHVPFADFLNGSLTTVTTPQRDEARKIATSLLKKHIERHLEQRGLKKFDTSTGSGYYFPSGLLHNDKIPYIAASGRKTNKNVVGRSERNKVNWHLSMKVNVVLGPPALVRFKPYVCFSDDGQVAITDTKRTSAIRRRFCKNWWNQHWRQLQEAFCVFLADGKETAEICLDGSEKLILAGKLLELTAVRKMPEDLKIAEEPDDPTEPDEDDTDDRDDPEGVELEDAA
jgi:TIR domain